MYMSFTYRYQRGSEVCEKLARSLEHLTGVEERELFDFGRRQVGLPSSSCASIRSARMRA